MCEQDLPGKTDQNSERRLTQKDFTLPEGWEPETPSGRKLKEMARQLRAALGPTWVQEILDEFITAKEPEDKDEDSHRRLMANQSQDILWDTLLRRQKTMSEQNGMEKTDQGPERRLTKEDFIIPEGWEPDIPSLKRIKEMGRQLRDALGPTLVQEILDEFITTKEPEGEEDSCRR